MHYIVRLKLEYYIVRLKLEYYYTSTFKHDGKVDVIILSQLIYSNVRHPIPLI